MDWNQQLPSGFSQLLRSLLDEEQPEVRGATISYLNNPDLENEDIEDEGNNHSNVQDTEDNEHIANRNMGSDEEVLANIDVLEALDWIKEPLPFILLFFLVFLVEHFLGTIYIISVIHFFLISCIGIVLFLCNTVTAMRYNALLKCHMVE